MKDINSIGEEKVQILTLPLDRLGKDVYVWK